MPSFSRRQFFGTMFLGAGATALRAADVPAALRIGMIQSMFRDVQPVLVQAMSRPLRDMIQRQTGLTGDVEILPEAAQLVERMKAKQIQLGVFHGFEYAWARKQCADLKPLVVTVPPGRKLQASVVVGQDCKHTALSDLKDEQILIPRATKAHCLLYLDRERVSLPASTAKPKFKPILTTEEALDAVHQGDAAAALVDAAALSGYEKLQPGVYKQLRILCSSEAFPQTVITYNKESVDATTLEKVRKLLTQANQTPAGKPLLMLWNLKGFEDVPADYSEQLDRIAKAYPPSEDSAATVAMPPAK